MCKPIFLHSPPQNHKNNGRTVFRTIFSAMLIAVLAEILLLVVGLCMTNVSGQLKQNSQDILAMQVTNRADYLQDILHQAQDLTSLSETVNATTQSLLASGAIDLATLADSSTTSEALLAQIADALMNTLREKPVTGIFVLLNTQDLSTREIDSSLPGIYLRDLDPDSRPSARNADLTLMRASASVVKKLGIATDTNWKPAFSFQGNENDDFFAKVYQAALTDNAQLDAEDYGRWTTVPYQLIYGNHTAIAYSVPLILPDGTVYGVLGVELLTEYLQSKLPYREIAEESAGTYYLVSTADDISEASFELQKAVTSGSDPYTVAGPTGILRCTQDSKGIWSVITRHTYYCSLSPLELYNRNAPFFNEHWYLVGIVQPDVLFESPNFLNKVLIGAVLVAVVVGLIGSFWVARSLARPTIRLYNEVLQAQEEHTFPKLSHTGVLELDRFAETITQLNLDLLDSSTKFLRIMEMASIEIGGYELRYDTGSVFVTENFFSLLGVPQLASKMLSVRDFESFLIRMQRVLPCHRTKDGDRVLTVSQNGETHYIRLRVSAETHNVQIGLVEDVTTTTLERLRIEHERDYDILTGLYNRQAFTREVAQLFSTPSLLGCSALLMMDLDNLKHINDTYGHDWGDLYLQLAGRSIDESIPGNAIRARLSGDEFIVFFYGAKDQAEIRDQIRALEDSLHRKSSSLPNGEELHIRLSGGISWYPQDGRTYSDLKKHADFAMYQVKHSSKGQFCEFDLGVYNQSEYHLLMQREFRQLIADERVVFHYQPIFSVKHEKPVAYEALMRSDLPTLHSPLTIMQMAHQMDALHDIERLTVFKSMEQFSLLVQNRLVPQNAMLFVNSIANVCLTDAEHLQIADLYPDLLQRLVVEITEDESLSVESLDSKRYAHGFSGIFALDDYGSGYANEATLLKLAPRYVKVDISIIRDIDKSPDKQELLSNIISYGHPRSMLIIAEGVETAEEMRTVIELGVDLLQGYFLAQPSAVPNKLSAEAAALIQEMRNSPPRFEEGET